MRITAKLALPACSLVLVVLTLAASSQQAAPGGSLDAASIKADGSASHNSSTHTDKGRITFVNVSLKTLVTSAFGRLPFEVDAPAWMDDARFDATITFANLPPDQPPRETRLLIQPWLMDQFQLKFHHETRSMPGYELVVAKGGPKLAPSSADCCSTSIDSGDNGLVKFISDTTMAQFATSLGLNLDRPDVHDKTGLTGVFHIELTYAPNRLSGASEGAAASAGPTIYEALQQELGLKLQSATFPTDILVIDHAQRTPKGN